MRVGIYTGTDMPTAGGSYTFMETIQKDICSSKCNHELFFLCNDDSYPQEFTRNEIKFLNLADTKRSLFYRLKRKILRMLGKHKNSILDDVLHTKHIDLLWILGPYALDVTIPYVFTVLDLGHRMLPGFPEVTTEGWKWDARENNYQRMLYRAAYIIAGNETGKKEILANYPVNPNKIKILPFPIPSFCFEVFEPKEKLDIEKPLIFYPAQFWAHKNHMAIIEALAWLRDEKKLKIYCYFVGSDKGNMDYVQSVIRKYRLEKQIFILGFVEQSTLTYLYKNALAMTYLSFMGPNNLPPLEAAALGCPVIISNILGHIEQMEGAGLLVDATDYKSVGNAIYKLYNKPAERKKIIARGLILAKKYKKYSYFAQMLQVINEYALYRKTWK